MLAFLKPLASHPALKLDYTYTAEFHFVHITTFLLHTVSAWGCFTQLSIDSYMSPHPISPLNVAAPH